LLSRLWQLYNAPEVSASIAMETDTPMDKHAKLTFAEILLLPELAARFSAIREASLWGSAETVSGPGSEMAYVQPMIPALVALFERHQVGSIIDAPCGDLNWMRDVLNKRPLRYYGFDIVPELIAANAQLESDRITLRVGDIRTLSFPKADLWLCRDCWFHFSFDDIHASLQAFLRSDIPFALLTSHVTEPGFLNTDIQSGDFRLINLFEAPFHFPRAYVYAIDDWIAPWPPRRLYLWHREQLAALDWGMRMQTELTIPVPGQVEAGP
jgi:Methyltransferase domain